MSDYTDRVERNLEGLKFVSSGINGHCRDCADHAGYAEAEDETGAILETTADMLDRFDDDVSRGKVTDEGAFSWCGCGVCGSPLGNTLYIWHAIDESGDVCHSDDMCPDCVLYLANGDEPESDPT